MALTIHAPHLPHLELWSRHRTMMIGIAAAAITAGTVYVVQQTNDSSPTATLSAPAATGSLELRSGHLLEGTGAFGVGTGVASSLELGSNLVPGTGAFGVGTGVAAAPAATASAASVAIPTVGPGSNSLNAVPLAPVVSAPAAAASSEFRSGHLLPGTNSLSAAPLAPVVADTGEFLGLDTAPAAAAAVGSSEFRSGHVLR